MESIAECDTICSIRKKYMTITLDHSINAFASCPKDMELLLAEELSQYHVDNIKQTVAGVYFSGSEEALYRACFWTRLANRIVVPLLKFTATSWDEFYRGLRQFNWDEHFSVKDTFAFRATVHASELNNSIYAAQKAKDAVADYFREKTGERPNVELIQPDIQFHLYIERTDITLSIDLCGESLHRRGYRLEAGEAPLKENLASAILLRAKWPIIARQGGELLDPMCGSGTFLIEGALMAADIAPGLLRAYYSCFGWKKFNPDCWRGIREEALQRRESGLLTLPRITGYDDDPAAIRITLANIERAKLTGYIHAERRALTECRPRSQATKGLFITNPPYGVRLGELASLRFTYHHLGELAKQHFVGWQLSVFTGNTELASSLRLARDKAYHFYNGDIKCQLLNFTLHEARSDIIKISVKPLLTDLEPLFTKVPGSCDFLNRLKKNKQQLKKWLDQTGSSCYRLYDADLPDFSMAVDIYENYCYVQEYAAPKSIDPKKAESRLLAALDILMYFLEINDSQVILKTRQKQKGLQQYEKMSDQKKILEVKEGAAKLLVNLTDYLDTGLFLDSRLIRQKIFEEACGKHFLNLFCYTGTATVFAALGKAASTTSVDLSNNYLEWAKQNLALNGLSSRQHRYIQADCLQWLEEENYKYDLILLDPPTFSNSKRMQGVLDIQKDHVDLIKACMRILKKDGQLLFVTNKQGFKLDESLTDLYFITETTKKTIPVDFKRSAIHHSYNVCLKEMRVPSGSSSSC